MVGRRDNVQEFRNSLRLSSASLAHQPPRPRNTSTFASAPPPPAAAASATHTAGLSTMSSQFSHPTSTSEASLPVSYLAVLFRKRTLTCSQIVTQSPSVPFYISTPRNPCHYVDYYFFTGPGGMEGWVGLVGLPIADSVPQVNYIRHFCFPIPTKTLS